MKTQSNTIKDLGGGLILRRSTVADTEQIAAFQSRIHSENPSGPDERIAWWIRDLLSGKHPTFNIDDFTVVEDTAAGKIASSLCLIDQVWSYEGIPFKVGRPEVVATDPEYRNRGLVRDQFNLIHSWAEQRGQMVQAITGIPYYYRLYGYEMSMDLTAGRDLFENHLPKLKENQAEPVQFRNAVLSDIPFIMQLYQQDCARSEVYCVRTEADWAYQIRDASEKNCERERIAMIETNDHRRIGMIIYSNELWGSIMPILTLEIIPGYPWMDACQSALRFLWAQGKELARETDSNFDTLGLWLGREHPAYAALPDRLPKVHLPYGMYMRVPDLPAFIMHIRPALEQRLYQSPASGYSGELKISFYKGMIRFVFTQGKIDLVEQTKDVNAKCQAAFPDLTFLQILFGGKSLDELQAFSPDCTVDPYSDARVLLNALFPKKQSNVLVLS